MIIPIDKHRRTPVESDSSPDSAGADDTGTGVWIGRIEAAARLGVRERTLDRMAADGMVERVFRRIPGCRPEPLFFLEQINRLLAARPAVFASLPQQPDLAEQDVPIPPHAGRIAAGSAPVPSRKGLVNRRHLCPSSRWKLLKIENHTPASPAESGWRFRVNMTLTAIMHAFRAIRALSERALLQS